MEASDARKLKVLADEKAKRKKQEAETMLDKANPKEVAPKKGGTREGNRSRGLKCANKEGGARGGGGGGCR